MSIGVSTSSGNIVNYLQTTPGQQNNSEEFLGSIENEVIFSETGGIKDGPVYLSLSGNDSSQVIHFTIDGSPPNSSSQIYTYPFEISNNMCIRTQIYSDDYSPSPVSTESYIFNSSHDIDVLLLAVDPIDFFDDDSGIYVFGQKVLMMLQYHTLVQISGKIGSVRFTFHFMKMTVMILLNLMQELRFLVVGVEVKMVNDHFHFLREGNMEIQNLHTFDN